MVLSNYHHTMRELGKCILKTVFKWGAEEGMENIVKDCFQMLFFLQLSFIPFRGTPCVTFYFDGIIMESGYIFNKCVNLYFVINNDRTVANCLLTVSALWARVPFNWGYSLTS